MIPRSTKERNVSQLATRHDLPSLRKIVTSEMVSEILCFFLKSILVSWDALRVRTWGPSPPRIRSYDSGCAAALIEQQTSNPAEPKIAREPSRPTDIPPKNQVQFTTPIRHGLLEKRSSLRWCHNRVPLHSLTSKSRVKRQAIDTDNLICSLIAFSFRRN